MQKHSPQSSEQPLLSEASISPQSWWLDEALAYEQYQSACEPLRGNHQSDVLIIGGGYTGLWTAIKLKCERPDLKVVLIEAAICGSGASGKNAGKVHGYWMSLPSLVDLLGKDNALEVARLGSLAQAEIAAFVKATDWDVWWIDGGGLKVATTEAHEQKLKAAAQKMRELDAGHKAQLLSPKAIEEKCASPSFRSGIFYPEEATVQPARLARALRAKAIALGVEIYENSAALDVENGKLCQAKTPLGTINASHVVMATNVALTKERDIRPNLVAFSSYAMVTEQCHDLAKKTGWVSNCSLSDSRMFLHYSRKTADDRIVFGAGSGPIAFGGKIEASDLSTDIATVRSVERGYRHLLPRAVNIRPHRAWGGAIDVASDRLPFARTRKGTNIHYAGGYSGHGVNPSYIMGRCLASLVLKQDNQWTRSPFCTRTLPTLPPEPLRYVGGRIIRSSILACEDSADIGKQAPWIARALSKLPELFNLRIGVR